MRAPSDPGETRASEIDLGAIRERLASGRGPTFWRGLDALANTAAFRRFVEREFPAAAHLARGPDRRSFFKIMAASFAMAGLAACDNDEDGRASEVPYVRQPERIEPGVPLSYATSTLVDGHANGVLVTTVNGRPIKIEGNPDHPWSLGGTDAFGQASILGLYDPARSQAVRYLDRIANWDAFRAAMLGPVAQRNDAKGEGLRLLTGPITSPSLVARVAALMKAMPRAKWHMDMALPPAARDAASAAVLGKRLDPRYAFERARVIVAIEGDFLDPGPAQVGLARRWAAARQASASHGGLLALHAASATPNLTSAKADFHVAAEPAVVAGLAARLLDAIDKPPPAPRDALERWLARAADALREAKGESIVLAGATQDAAVHAAVHKLNAALGNIGKTVTFAEPVLPEAGTLADLVKDMARGEVSTLLIWDANPVLTAPGDLGFIDALAKVVLKVHAGLYVDETALRCDWHLPLAHPLESWGDARAVDGTAGLIQPVVRPFYDGRTPAEILSILFDGEARDAQTLLRAYWRGASAMDGKDDAGFDAAWAKALTDGFIANTAAPEQQARVNTAATVPASGEPTDIRPDALTLLFRLDPTIWDGSLAANGWLQELPKPLTKITWGNVAFVSPALAEKEKIANGDVLAISVGKKTIEAPAWILPGQAEHSVTLTLGYGRAVADMIFDGLGYDANPLRSVASPWLATGANLRKTARNVEIATTQDYNTMEGHDFIKIFRDGDAPLRAGDAAPASLYGTSGIAKSERAWGMVIDTDACIGCNACVVACQSENNIAIVGKEQIAMGRGMHWLRVDRYYSSEKSDATDTALDDPDTHFQPVPCMHCELAPCEVGCPVEATLHDHEGLNLMVYNRCVGTRACSGYCPYKVRRFNYLDYSGGAAPSIEAGRNPDVTVRARGVMEKCTYCVQRIARARIASDKTGEPIADGAVTTACQDACPTRAITFGDLSDHKSAVVDKRGDPRNYDLLGALNVRPRTTYLAERAPRARAKEG